MFDETQFESKVLLECDTPDLDNFGHESDLEFYKELLNGRAE